MSVLFHQHVKEHFRFAVVVFTHLPDDAEHILTAVHQACDDSVVLTGDVSKHPILRIEHLDSLFVVRVVGFSLESEPVSLIQFIQQHVDVLPEHHAGYRCPDEGDPLLERVPVLAFIIIYPVEDYILV